MNWAVLPLKDFVDAKQRLSPVLEPHERRALVRAMLEDVLTVLTQCTQIQRVLIVSHEPEADAIAQRYGATVLKPAPRFKPCGTRGGRVCACAQG